MNHQASAQFNYVDNNAQLERLVDRMIHAEKIALDTEADSLHHYFAKVCLIQLSFDNENYIVDPLADADLSGFLGLLSEKPIILHGADYDLRMLRTTFGFRPQREVFDTMIAAQILGMNEIGLTALVQQFFNVPLGNLGKKTDWSHRPLTPAQLQYACEDTHYLHALAEILESQMRDKDRCEWHREACERVVLATALDKPRDLDKVWRIKGVRFLDRRQMAFLREIWHWRENEAQQVDLPPFKILGNKKLLEIVEYICSHTGNLNTHDLRLPRNCTGERLRYLEKAIQKAQQLPPSEWPQIHKTQRPIPSVPNCKSQIDAMINECSHIAQCLGIAPSVLATRAALTAIAHHRPQSISEILDCSPMMRWQAKLMYPSIQKILDHEGMEMEG